VKNICFDLCAIPLYCLILWTCYTKKLAKGRANRTFVAFNIVSLICALADIWMEYVVNPLPITGGAVVLGTAISFTYKLLRNSCNLVYLVYVFLITKTDYRLHQFKWRAARNCSVLPRRTPSVWPIGQPAPPRGMAAHTSGREPIRRICSPKASLLEGGGPHSGPEGVWD